LSLFVTRKHVNPLFLDLMSHVTVLLLPRPLLPALVYVVVC